MASINITIELPDSSDTDFTNTLCSYWGWEKTLIDEEGNETPNPISQEVCIQNSLLEIVKNIYQSVKSNEAQDLARNQSIADSRAVTSQVVTKNI
jgi:hypothetical protein